MALTLFFDNDVIESSSNDRVVSGRVSRQLAWTHRKFPVPWNKPSSGDIFIGNCHPPRQHLKTSTTRTPMGVYSLGGIFVGLICHACQLPDHYIEATHNRYKISSSGHSKSDPAPYCRVLSPGNLNSMIPNPLPI